MKLAAKTDIGNQRSENQDSYRAGRRPNETVWGVVCDGMGGARGGRLASTTAVDIWEKTMTSMLDEVHTPEDVRALLLTTADEANHAVYAKASETPLLHGMGTTAVSAVISGGMVHYAHVGDSRAYLFRNNKLLQLTKDHSMVQELVERGALTAEQAENHPRKNLITRALGVTETVKADFGRKEVSPGDIILLCSDGLSNFVSVAGMEKILSDVPFFEAPDELVERALEGGGLDNITVLLMEVEAVEESNG